MKRFIEVVFINAWRFWLMLGALYLSAEIVRAIT
jgi:hypothetical protein